MNQTEKLSNLFGTEGEVDDDDKNSDHYDDRDYDAHSPSPRRDEKSSRAPFNWAWATHPLMIALYTGILVFIILCAFRPIFVTSQVKIVASASALNDTEKIMQSKRRKLSLLKVFIWSILSALIVAVVPYIVMVVVDKKPFKL